MDFFGAAAFLTAAFLGTIAYCSGRHRAGDGPFGETCPSRFVLFGAFGRPWSTVDAHSQPKPAQTSDWRGIRRSCHSSTYHLGMDGKVVVVTGASDGVGAAAARAFFRHGATVVAVGRSPEKTNQIAAYVGTEPHLADFSQLASVRRLAAELVRRYPRIDVLANNAGGVWPRRRLTEDGHEMTFQVNHLAPFLLTRLLSGPLAAGGARVVVTSSAAHRSGHVRLDDLDSARWYFQSVVYGTTKLENILFAAELARRGTGEGITATSFHPGVVATRFGRDSGVVRRLYQLGQPLMKTPAQGADTLVWLATAPPSEWRNGGYFADRREAAVRGQAGDATLASALWERSEKILGLGP